MIGNIKVPIVDRIMGNVAPIFRINLIRIRKEAESNRENPPGRGRILQLLEQPLVVGEFCFGSLRQMLFNIGFQIRPFDLMHEFAKCHSVSSYWLRDKNNRRISQITTQVFYGRNNCPRGMMSSAISWFMSRLGIRKPLFCIFVMIVESEKRMPCNGWI